MSNIAGRVHRFGEALEKAAAMALWVKARDQSWKDQRTADYWAATKRADDLLRHIRLVERELIEEYGAWPSNMPPRKT